MSEVPPPATVEPLLPPPMVPSPSEDTPVAMEQDVQDVPAHAETVHSPGSSSTPAAEPEEESVPSQDAQDAQEPEPSTVSDLPSYVLLVGLGVCAVVVQVVLRRVDVHALWVSPAVLALLERQGRLPAAGSPEDRIDGGLVVRDEHGEPTGVFVDKAMELVQKDKKKFVLSPLLAFWHESNLFSGESGSRNRRRKKSVKLVRRNV